jgi:hypothetical protein
MGKHKRKYCKVDKLTDERKLELKNLINKKTATYGEIAKITQGWEVPLSYETIRRYADKIYTINDDIQNQQNALIAANNAIKEIEDLDLSEAALRLTHGKLLEAASKISPKELDKLSAKEIINMVSGLTRTEMQKKKSESQIRDAEQNAVKKFRADIFAALGQKSPELYEKLKEFLEEEAQNIAQTISQEELI